MLLCFPCPVPCPVSLSVPRLFLFLDFFLLQLFLRPMLFFLVSMFIDLQSLFRPLLYFVLSCLVHKSCSLFRSWFSLPAVPDSLTCTLSSVYCSGLAFSLPYSLIKFPFPLLYCVPCFIRSSSRLCSLSCLFPALFPYLVSFPFAFLYSRLNGSSFLHLFTVQPFPCPISFLSSLCFAVFPALFAEPLCTVHRPAYSLPYSLIQFPFPLLCCVPYFICSSSLPCLLLSCSPPSKFCDDGDIFPAIFPPLFD
jgi:hypothetical protein